jgi:hypothetical protein
MEGGNCPRRCQVSPGGDASEESNKRLERLLKALRSAVDEERLLLVALIEQRKLE